MTRVTHLVQWIPLLYMCFFLIYWIQIYSNEMIEFDEYVLEKQVNYAADAAVEELLMTGDTDQDYNKGEYIVVEPDLAVTEFMSIIAEDYNFVPTDFTENLIKQQYIKAFVVCTWDGFYTYWYQPKDSTNEYGLVGTPKVPYFYTDDDGVQYCLNLGFETAYHDAGDTEETYKIVNTEKVNIPKHVQLTAINNQVADALNYALIQAYGGSTATHISIPALASEVSGQQPIDQITVLGVVEGQGSVLTSTILAECIGGAQVTKADPVIGVKLKYTSGMEAKVYAYSSYWKHQIGELSKYANVVGIVGTPEGEPFDITKSDYEFFDTPYEAAQSGYYDLFTTLDDGVANQVEEEEEEVE